MSGLNTFTGGQEGSIERMINLPKHIRENALQDLGQLGSNNSGQNKKTILNVLEPLVGSGIPQKVYMDKDLMLKFMELVRQQRNNIGTLGEELTAKNF